MAGRLGGGGGETRQPALSHRKAAELLGSRWLVLGRNLRLVLPHYLIFQMKRKIWISMSNFYFKKF